MEMKHINELLPADYNPRKDLKNGDPEFEKLKEGIREFGIVQPIVYNVRNNVVVGGHQRLKAAKAIGYEQVPVMQVDLDEDKEKALNLALNKISGDWDEDKLGVMLNELKMGDFNVDLTGFDEIEVEELTFAFDSLTSSDFTEEEGEELYHEGNDEEMSHDDDNDESAPEDEREERGYVVQTNIIFDDETQQETWHTFVRLLKKKYDPEAFPTIASRLHAHLVKEVIPELEREDAESE